MNTIAVIPAFNAEERLASVIRTVGNYLADILVVDDGSSDATPKIAESLGASVISHLSNMGKGAALKTGFKFAVDRNYDSALTLDADGQHRADYIPAFLRLSGDSDLIIGSRIHNKLNMPWDRRFSNWSSSAVLSRLLQVKIEDAQSGFRLHSRRLLETLELESDRFELETEIIIRAVQAGFKIKFIPISVEYGLSYPTHMNSLIDTLRWCKMVLETI